ncbi:MAG TPA: WD40 repeat domain-containing protein, partial [Gemmataceae bacterium]|nr:WD40 repeat domain-containing protein [Gemmataceae bacterium]
DRNRRYETAKDFAADIQRYLGDEPVQACPPSAGYRFRKFARRNKAALATASFIGLAMLAAVAVLAASTILIAREQQLTANALQAETNALQAETRARDELRRDAYFHRIALAQRELSADNLGGALKLLDDCPPDLRKWEWYYLKRLCRVAAVIHKDSSEIYGVAFEGDERIAAAFGDGTVKVLDARTGKAIQTLRGHEAYVFSVASSRDGRRLASASFDKKVQIWDRAKGERIPPLPGHVGDFSGMAYAVALSPDGHFLVAGGEDGFATIWNAADGREIHRLPEQHESTASCAAFSPDGRLLATGSWGGVLRIWDVHTGQLHHKSSEHTHRLSAIVFWPDSRRLATASFDRTVKIWNAQTGELERSWRAHEGIITGLAVSSDGHRFFSSGGEDKTVKIWDPLTGREVLSLRGHTRLCQCLALSPDGDRLASASADGEIRIWDATPLREDEGFDVQTFEHDSEVWSVAFSPDGAFLASAGWGDRTVRLWDARTGTRLWTLTLPQNVLNLFRVAFSPDSKRLAVAAVSGDRTSIVKVCDSATGREVREEISEKRSVPFCVTFDPTGRYLIREGPGPTVQVRNAQTGEVVGVVGQHLRQIWSMAFSPVDQRLVTASNDGTVRIWTWDPTHLGVKQKALELSVRVSGYTNRVAFSPDGQFLATGGERNSVKIWDAKTGDALQTLPGHTGEVYAVAFSPDGRWLATAGEDTTIRIWDSRSWTLQRTLRGHRSFVMSLAFRRDSERLASGSRDRTMTVWDTTSWDKAPAR